MTQRHLPDRIGYGLVLNRVVRLHNLLKIDFVAVIEARIDFHRVFKQARIGLDADALADTVHEALTNGRKIAIGEQRIGKLRTVLRLNIVGNTNALDGFFPIFICSFKKVFKGKNSGYVDIKYRTCKRDILSN